MSGGGSVAPPFTAGSSHLTFYRKAHESGYPHRVCGRQNVGIAEVFEIVAGGRGG